MSRSNIESSGAGQAEPGQILSAKAESMYVPVRLEDKLKIVRAIVSEALSRDLYYISKEALHRGCNFESVSYNNICKLTEPVRLEETMHESFYSLQKEKQRRIINAAMKVFAGSPYGKASTDDIAALAGISKGSLFYHFKNKKDLYCYLYEFSCKTIYRKIDENHAMDKADFFERNVEIVKARVQAMVEHPAIFDFAMRAYYETDPAVAGKIQAVNRKILQGYSGKLYENIDLSKFRNKEDAGRATQMIIWIGEGFLKERMARGNLDLKEIQAEACGYMEILKHGFYR